MTYNFVESDYESNFRASGLLGLLGENYINQLKSQMKLEILRLRFSSDSTEIWKINKISDEELLYTKGEETKVNKLVRKKEQ